MYRFPWYLTLVSTNHVSSNPGLVVIRVPNVNLSDFRFLLVHFGN